MNIIFDGYIWQWLNTSNFQVQNVCIFRQTTRKITNRRPLWHLPIGCYRRWPIPHPPSNISSQYQNLTVYRLQWLYLPLTTMKHYSLWYWTPQLRGLVSNSGSARQSWTLRWPLQQHVCLSNCIGGGGGGPIFIWIGWVHDEVLKGAERCDTFDRRFYHCWCLYETSFPCQIVLLQKNVSANRYILKYVKSIYGISFRLVRQKEFQNRP